MSDFLSFEEAELKLLWAIKRLEQAQWARKTTEDGLLQCLAAFKRHVKPYDEAKCHFYLGMLYRIRQDPECYEKAKGHLGRAFYFFWQQEKYRDLAKVILEALNLYRNNNSFDEAIEFLALVQGHVEHFPLDLKARFFYSQGLLLLKENHYVLAARSLDIASGIFSLIWEQRRRDQENTKLEATYHKLLRKKASCQLLLAESLRASREGLSHTSSVQSEQVAGRWYTEELRLLLDRLSRRHGVRRLLDSATLEGKVQPPSLGAAADILLKSSLKSYWTAFECAERDFLQRELPQLRRSDEIPLECLLQRSVSLLAETNQVQELNELSSRVKENRDMAAALQPFAAQLEALGLDVSLSSNTDTEGSPESRGKKEEKDSAARAMVSLSSASREKKIPRMLKRLKEWNNLGQADTFAVADPCLVLATCRTTRQKAFKTKAPASSDKIGVLESVAVANLEDVRLPKKQRTARRR
jgi:hypothetical protein